MRRTFHFEFGDFVITPHRRVSIVRIAAFLRAGVADRAARPVEPNSCVDANMTRSCKNDAVKITVLATLG